MRKPAQPTQPDLYGSLQYIAGFCGEHFDLYRLAGSRNAAHRAELLSQLRGRRATQAEAGINNLRRAFHAALSVTGTCPADQDEHFKYAAIAALCTCSDCRRNDSATDLEHGLTYMLGLCADCKRPICGLCQPAHLRMHQEENEARYRAQLPAPTPPPDPREIEPRAKAQASRPQPPAPAATPTANCSAPVYTDPEARLRADWTARGIPQSRQDEILCINAEKAAPGATVGPFRISSNRAQLIERARRFFPEKTADHFEQFTNAQLMMIGDRAQAVAEDHFETHPDGSHSRNMPADDPEAEAREDADCAAPTAELTDTWSEPAALRRSFGTRPPRPLKPARQDRLFDPIPQLSLFSGGN